MKLLIVEDNKELATSIHDFLKAEGCICEVAYSFQQAIDRLSAFTYDIVILDIMLPDGNGLDVLRFIRTDHIDTGVLIISAKGALDDRVKGLEFGADDYVTKPFHMSELNARLRAIFRRKKMDGNNLISFNEISLNPDTLEATVHNNLLDITRKEFDLLMYFVVNKNRVLSRQAIATHLWGDYTDNLSNFDFVYQHVKNLRKKISALQGTDYIDTVYGLGYKFNTAKS